MNIGCTGNYRKEEYYTILNKIYTILEKTDAKLLISSDLEKNLDFQMFKKCSGRNHLRYIPFLKMESDPNENRDRSCQKNGDPAKLIQLRHRKSLQILPKRGE